MAHIDTVALAIDWLDTCKRKDCDSLAKLYSLAAIVTIPADKTNGRVLTGRSDIASYWMHTFETSPGIRFDLVELYPGAESAILIYYDERCQRVSEYLQFDGEGLIVSAARHTIPRQRQDRVVLGATDTSVSPTQKAVLRCEARQTLYEARRLPVGPARNDLRQRAIALRELSKPCDHACRNFAIG